jgi:hypothetical protein
MVQLDPTPTVDTCRLEIQLLEWEWENVYHHCEDENYRRWRLPLIEQSIRVFRQAIVALERRDLFM